MNYIRVKKKHNFIKKNENADNGMKYVLCKTDVDQLGCYVCWFDLSHWVVFSATEVVDHPLISLLAPCASVNFEFFFPND